VVGTAVPAGTHVRIFSVAALNKGQGEPHMTTIEHRTLPDGTRLTLRPVREQDAAGLLALIQELPQRDRRWRFHGAVNGVTAATLREMTRTDPRKTIALVVVADTQGVERLVADIRCAVDGTAQGAEFALMVAAAWRRAGIGQWLLAALHRACARARLRWLHGEVLADNAPMLALMRRCGFLCTPHRTDERLVAVEARVDPVAWPGHGALRLAPPAPTPQTLTTRWARGRPDWDALLRRSVLRRSA
jgi:GNAT superfamily N-acetyltransferase